MRFTLRFFLCTIATLAVRFALGRLDLCGFAPATPAVPSPDRTRP
jgi:hypothetical protein